METDENGVYVAYNEEAIYADPDWSDPDAASYVELEDGSGAHGIEGRQAARPQMTVIGRKGNRTTVRTNRTITFSGSIPFNGSVSGTVPAGATFTGEDANGNGVPDVLESQIKSGRARFPALGE